MKKYILTMALVSFFFAAVSAQDEVATSKKEIVYPTAGTFSIGVDATPYIEFVGNMFNGTEDNSFSAGQQIINGKYFLSEKSAVRFDLSIKNNKSNDLYYVVDDSQTPVDNDIEVEDLRISKGNNIAFGLGYQEYMGQGRLRAFYGGQLGYSLSRTKYEYQYGNEMTVDNASPSTYWWGRQSERTLTYDNGRDQAFSVGGFVGVEYFVNSIISIGGEAGLYASYAWHTQEDRTYETIDQGSYVVKSEAIDPPASEFSLNTTIYDTSMTAGRIYINFYF